ncbi:MAG TPA: asparagine synthase (glutamine-hydrolyzing) [Baekduia sp.]|nr:asparagine synthase (glutamine-hydrolyzing) [Baekduia sp.]
MCGICGVVQLSGAPREVIAAERLAHMTNTMVHRGPDDLGMHQAPGVAFGMRRLAVQDVEGGHQPFSNEAGDVWAIQNGEIYNHPELRRELEPRGHRFHTRCDTEVIPHVYEQHGDRFPAHLRGKFGIAVWDERRRRAVLARDRLGVKPLYYAQAGDLLVFGSELKAVLASGLIDPALDYDAIDSYLTLGFIPMEATPLAAVRRLPHGHALIVEDGGFRVQPYWTYPVPRVSAPRRSADEYAEGLIAELEDAVRLRLMSDVPLGAMLSGGLDSSLIVALMARNMSEPVKTFSIGFAEEREVNELDDARFVAAHYGTDHHELELSFEHDTVDLEELVWHLDEPIADMSALGFHAVSQLAARHVTVALSGQGADELLGGYKKHRAAALVGAWRSLPGPMRRAGDRLAPYAPARFGQMARTLAAPDPVARLVEMSGRLGGGLREALYCGPLEARGGEAAMAAMRQALGAAADDPLPVTLHLDAQIGLDYLLHYFDRASMAHSLEVRVPFLDHRVVEYCAGIPGDLKVRRLQSKHILKRASEGLVPDRIVHKRKLGFLRGSSGAWLQAQLTRTAGDYLLTDAPGYAEFLDRSVVQRMLRDHRDGRGTADVHLLIAILMLELWLQTYLPRAMAGAAPKPPVLSLR